MKKRPAPDDKAESDNPPAAPPAKKAKLSPVVEQQSSSSCPSRREQTSTRRPATSKYKSKAKRGSSPQKSKCIGLSDNSPLRVSAARAVEAPKEDLVDTRKKTGMKDKNGKAKPVPSAKQKLAANTKAQKAKTEVSGLNPTLADPSTQKGEKPVIEVCKRAPFVVFDKPAFLRTL